MNKYNETRCDSITLIDDRLDAAFKKAINHLFSVYRKDVLDDLDEVSAKITKTQKRQKELHRLFKSIEKPAETIDFDSLVRVLIYKAIVKDSSKIEFIFIDGNTYDFELYEWSVIGNCRKEDHKLIMPKRKKPTA